MEHYSPLPLALVFGAIGGAGLAVVCLMNGSGVLLALMAYSFGGAATLIGSAALLVRKPQLAHTTLAPCAGSAQGD